MNKRVNLYALDHRLGAGFGSEVNNLLYAIYFFERRGDEYQIISLDWVAAYRHGWTDYFTSLQEEHRTISYRFWLVKQLIGGNRWLRHRLSAEMYHRVNYRIVRPLLKLVCGGQCYMRGGPGFEQLRDYCYAARLRDYKSFRQSMHRILERIWQPVLSISEAAAKYRPTSNEYLALHVRRGDKITSGEDRSYGLEEYAVALRNLDTPVRTLFVMTDDRSIVDDLRVRLPEFSIVTGPGHQQRGYDQATFQGLPPDELRTATKHLMIEIEIARRAVLFVGTFKSNLFRLVDYLRPGGCIDVSAVDRSASDL